MAKWPGTIVSDDEVFARSLTPYGDAPHTAPQRERVGPQGTQAITAAQPAQPPETATSTPSGYPGTPLPYDPLGRGDIGFANPGSSETDPNAEAYAREVDAGVLSGTVSRPEDVWAIAAKYGYGRADREALEKAFASLQKGAKYGGAMMPEIPTPTIAELRKDALLPEQIDAYARGIPGTFGLDDEIDAIVTTATRGGEFKQNLANSRAIRDYDKENNFWSRFAGEVTGGVATGAGIPSGLRTVAREAAWGAMRGGLGREAALAAARRAVVAQSAREGGALGGTAGFLEADGNLGDRALGGVGGGLAGAGTGGALSYLGSAISQRGMREVDRVASPAESFVDAAAAQGVDYLPADIPKAYGSQFATAITNSTLGAVPLSEGADRAVSSLASAKTRVASDIGRVADDVGAGQAIQRGVTAFSRDDSTTSKLYDAIPVPAARLASLTNTREALRDLTGGMDSNTVLSKIWADHPRLRATLDALTPKTTPGREPGSLNPIPTRTNFEGGQLSWGDLKRFRTIVGEIVGKPSLTSEGSDIAAMRRLYGALSEDMRATAGSVSVKALNAFERANSYARARSARIDRVIKPLLGDDYQQSPEDALRTLKSWSKAQGGDFASVAQLFRSLPSKEADTVRASVFGALGRASKGRQDETGQVFSPADFMTQWSDLSPRAKSVLFSEDHRKAIDQIVTLADAMKASGKYANTSKTGIAVGGASTIGSFLANPILGTLYVSGQFGAGKLLASPKFARWLAGAGKKPNRSAVRDHVQRLTAVARAEPAIAADVLSIQRRLTEAFDSPARIAADEVPDHGGGIIGQDQEGAEQRRQPDATP